MTRRIRRLKCLERFEGRLGGCYISPATVTVTVTCVVWDTVPLVAVIVTV